MKTIANGSTRSLQYYAVTLAWIDDLKYFKAEANYLSAQFDENDMNVSSKYYQGKIERMKITMLRLKRDMEKLHSMLMHQLERLCLVIEDKLKENAEDLEFSQVRLEYIMKDFCKAYRKLKMNFFELVNSINDVDVPEFYQ